MDIETLEQFASSNNVSLSNIKQMIITQENKEVEEKYLAQYKANEKYLGRYFCWSISPREGMFPVMKQFYKVISTRTREPYEVYCLTFQEHPTYWFEYQAHRVHYKGDYYLGEFDFKSFHVESMTIPTLGQMNEIDESLWNYHANSYLRELLDMKWYEDHWRYGGKLPGDDKWRVK